MAETRRGLERVPWERYRNTRDLARQFRRDMTVPERTLWNALSNRQVLGIKFRRQHPIGGYIVDFYASSLKLAIEVDGPVHLTRAHADHVRQALLEAQEIWFVRFTAEEVETNTWVCVERLKKAIVEEQERRARARR